jgi:hypothetical protein
MFERQFREDFAVAERYAKEQPLVLFRKRLKTEAILGAYRTLARVGARS